MIHLPIIPKLLLATVTIGILFPSTVYNVSRLSYAPFSSLVTPRLSCAHSGSLGFSFVLACSSGVVRVGHQAILSAMRIFPCHSKCLNTISHVNRAAFLKGTHDATCVTQMIGFYHT